MTDSTVHIHDLHVVALSEGNMVIIEQAIVPLSSPFMILRNTHCDGTSRMTVNSWFAMPCSLACLSGVHADSSWSAQEGGGVHQQVATVNTSNTYW